MAHINQAKEEAFREGHLKAVDTMAQETAKEMLDLEKQRDAYRQELIETLQTLSDGDTQFAFPAHLRLGELTGKSHTNICQGDGMELSTLKAILAQGDKYGSAIRQMLADLRICDLSNVTEEQAQWWLSKQKGGDNDDKPYNK